jgi:putative tryptophan/tyrosine transport system substrate-binding protein
MASLRACPARAGISLDLATWKASMAPKWLELLTEIAPGIKRVGFMFNPDTGPFARLYFLPSFEVAARSLRLLSIVAPVRSDAEIETVMASLGDELGSGLVVITDAFVASHHALIISLAARNSVPAVFRNSEFVRDGALLSCGPDIRDDFRRAASYVDRILRGEKPADLPVQPLVKFEMALNAKTAKALDLTIPTNLLVRADEGDRMRREFIAGLGSAAVLADYSARTAARSPT